MRGARRLREAADFARVLALAAPPAIVAVSFAPAGSRFWSALSAALVVSAGMAWWQRSMAARRLRTTASVLASFREGDFSVRARLARGDSLFDDVLREVNQLGDTLREHRLGEMEAWALLRKVMAEIDVLVLAFDEGGRVRLANEASARLLGVPAPSLVGRHASELGIAELLEGEAPRAIKGASFGAGPWELRRGPFRLSGQLHALVVLSDLGGALREQERDAYKRLIRVMGHEINNSLAPIQSIAQSVLQTMGQSPRPDDWEQDVGSGLEVVARRAEALGRFTNAYARLARLPRPNLGEVRVAQWVRRAASLEQRLDVAVDEGPDVVVRGDADQLDQLLINLLKNAVDATLEAPGGRGGRAAGGVRLRWSVAGRALSVVVEDDGPGVGETANLFVPFFTTKPGGSGIGLVLARQIAEAHGGEVMLRSRSDGAPGAEACVRLPMRG